jgi:hypothetical protein
MTETHAPSPRMVALALSLSELTGQRWAASTKGGWGTTLSGPGQAQLTAELCEGRVYIDGNFPGGFGPAKCYRITVSQDKSAPAVARDIQRRLLNAGYTEALASAIESKAAKERREAERLALLVQVAELFGKQPPTSPEYGVRLSELCTVAGSGDVKAYWRGSDRLNIELAGIPAGVALAMLAVLAEAEKRQGPVPACCAADKYHDAILTGPGCLQKWAG